jgi:hypothetical protein
MNPGRDNSRSSIISFVSSQVKPLPLSHSIRNRYRTAFTLLLAVACARAAFAMNVVQTPDCDVSGETLNCKLLDVLHFLYGAAGVLAFILLLVVGVAIHIYRKNKRQGKDPR